MLKVAAGLYLAISLVVSVRGAAMVHSSEDAPFDSIECSSENGEEGTCIPLYDCDHLTNNVHEKDSSPQVERSTCPRSLVCCKASRNSTIFSDVSLPSFKKRITRRQILLLPADCGRRELSDRIVGGVDAELGSWPWIVILGGTNKLTTDFEWFCGGSLITERYVLTAAHCMDVHMLEVARIGELDLRQNPDCNEDHCAPRKQDIEIERISLHNEYNKSESIVYNDIALLRLQKPATLHFPYVFPICLPVDPERDMGYSVEEFEGKRASAAGWGTITKNPEIHFQPDFLQEVSLPIHTLPYCDKMRSLFPDPKTILCAGGEGKDTCGGDSGGPLTLQETGNTKSFLVGITSLGPLYCGTPDTQAVYTSVHHYISWILENVEP